MKKLLIVVAVLGVLAGCGKNKVSFDTVETARAQARENALYNATKHRAASPQYSEWNIEGRGDSSQTNECPQGDGWATMDFIAPNNKQVIQFKCSTVSGNIGCLESNDFKKKAYASEDGQCQPTEKVPHPLPKIKK